MKIILLLIISSYIPSCLSVHNIVRYGAKPTDKQPPVEIALANTAAIISAINAANEDSSDRVAYVPANETFYFSATYLENIHDVTFQIDGILRAHDNITDWPKDSGGTGYDELHFKNTTNVSIVGSGTIDGQGYIWWWDSISMFLPGVTHNDRRGKMITFEESTNVLIDGLTMINSPTWHINFDDCDNVTVSNFYIWVNVTSQRDLLKSAGLFGKGDRVGLPTFPLNTDGIDPKASNVHIYNGVVENYDDGIVFKPCRKTSTYCKQCSGGYVHDLKVIFSVGLSIGSVPPNNDVNCVKDVVFKDIQMLDPLKGIYLKSNPGTSGTGLIQNITYENIFLNRSLWWPIWIGPQQQHQPGDGPGGGTGCSFIYPKHGSSCPTNPLVTFKDITLRNVTAIHGHNDYPGALLGNVSNPFTGFVFDNVHVQEGKGQDYTLDFLVDNVYGVATNCTPALTFLP